MPAGSLDDRRRQPEEKVKTYLYERPRLNVSSPVHNSTSGSSSSFFFFFLFSFSLFPFPLLRHLCSRRIKPVTITPTIAVGRRPQAQRDATMCSSTSPFTRSGMGGQRRTLYFAEKQNPIAWPAGAPPSLGDREREEAIPE